MKIGIFDPYLNDLGGGERYMMTIAKCLSEKHQVEVFWDNKKDLQDIQERFDLDLSNINLGENIFTLPLREKLVRSKNYDTIIVLSDGSIPIFLSKKLFLHIQQPLSIKISLKDKLKLKKVNGIFCNSEFTRKSIEKAFNAKCDLLYPPVSIVGNQSKKENIIFHVGRFRILNVKTEDYKKQQVMIDTFKRLVDKGLSSWKFVLAVSLPNINDEKFEKMKKSATGYPIEFLVNSNNERLWEKGAKAKIYWHATGFGEDLDKNPHLAEHFGISTVEAMGAGVVPVVINAGGQKEIVENEKSGYLWNTLDELEEKTLRLINDQELLSKMSKEAYERAKRFDEENFCKNIFEIINA